MSNRPKITVIVANLGTPDAPTPSAVRKFLRHFLSDTRVIEIPKPIWQIILNCFILPFRPKRVAHAYEQIWQDGSPMKNIMDKQVEAILSQLIEKYPHFDLNIVPAMAYSSPNILDVLNQYKTSDEIILLPLYPQYSATTTAALYDVVAKWLMKQRHIPALHLIKDYYQHPLYINALAQSVRDYWAIHGQAEKLLMSFHGIPQPNVDKGDPYAERCRKTAQLTAQALGLNDDQWAVSFQSRFGAQEWVKPYTDVILPEWAKQGVKSVHIISPAFSADCLETLEELAIQNAELFQEHGGESYAYIPALNERADHINLFVQMIEAQLKASEIHQQAFISSSST